MEISVVDKARRRFVYFLLLVISLQAVGFLLFELLVLRTVQRGEWLLNTGSLLFCLIVFVWIKRVTILDRVLQFLTLGMLVALLYFSYSMVEIPFIAGFFFPMFPLFAFFLRGKREGVWWLGLFTLITLGGMYLARLGILALPYLLYPSVWVHLLDLTIYLSVVYFYVEVEEESRGLLITQAQRQKEMTDQLLKESAARIKTETALKAKVQEIERVNTLMVGREVAMSALKREIKALKQPGVERATEKGV